MSSKTLAWSPDLRPPVDIATQTTLIVGKRGSGKSTTAVRLVEQLHRLHVPFVVCDPLDNWWGLKAAKDGVSPGLANVYVCGGAHADLPIEPSGGALMADVVCEHRTSMVLSCKHFSGLERSRFMTAFALRLLQYVRDESHRFAQHYHHLLRRKRTLGE